MHLLSQRPGRTGSGVYLQSLIRCAHAAGLEQCAIVGIPADEHPSLPPLPASRIEAVRFDTPQLPFPVPGMSDVMPYPSTRFSQLHGDQLDRYRRAFTGAIIETAARFKPDVVHTHHLWLATAIAASTLDTPVVTSCHGTGLRQCALASHLKPLVIPGCRQVARSLVLTDLMGKQVIDQYGLAPQQVVTCGTGYDAERFKPADRSGPRAIADAEAAIGCELPKSGIRLAYAGKLSQAKGVVELLDAVSLLTERDGPGFTLLIAGGGTGSEAASIRSRAAELGDRVQLLGFLGHDQLAPLLRCCDLFVLPSYYEGLPLVLIEALASGCRLVTTDLPNIRELLPDPPDELVQWVSLPRMVGIDQPDQQDLPAFVEALAGAIAQQLARIEASARQPQAREALNRRVAKLASAHTWDAVFERIHAVYCSVVG